MNFHAVEFNEAGHGMTTVEIGMKKPRKGDRRSFSEVKLLERYEFLKEFNLAPKIAHPLSPLFRKRRFRSKNCLPQL